MTKRMNNVTDGLSRVAALVVEVSARAVLALGALALVLVALLVLLLIGGR